jgi:hypothetical protein
VIELDAAHSVLVLNLPRAARRSGHQFAAMVRSSVAPWTFIVGCGMEVSNAVVQKPTHTPSPAPNSFGLVVRGRRRRNDHLFHPGVGA